MRAGERHDLPARVERVRKRFERWRRTRKPRARIPDSLWAAAVEVAGTFGLHRTARALPVEYYSLKKRMEQHSVAGRGRHEPGPETAFVELPPVEHGFAAAPASGWDCSLELEDTAGSKMRIHLKAAAPPDLAALCRSFWNPVP
jgi:hypothetical protein